MAKRKCKKCKGRVALVSGRWYYEADPEPYESGKEEKAIIDNSDKYVFGYVCDDCGHVQNLWHE